MYLALVGAIGSGKEAEGAGPPVRGHRTFGASALESGIWIMQITVGYNSIKRHQIAAAATAVVVAVVLAVGILLAVQVERSGTLSLPENTRPMILIPLPR